MYKRYEAKAIEAYSSNDKGIIDVYKVITDNGLVFMVKKHHNTGEYVPLTETQRCNTIFINGAPIVPSIDIEVFQESGKLGKISVIKAISGWLSNRGGTKNFAKFSNRPSALFEAYKRSRCDGDCFWNMLTDDEKAKLKDVAIDFYRRDYHIVK